MIDGTTGRSYWNRPRYWIWLNCLALTVLTPITHSILVVGSLFRIGNLHHFRQAYADPTGWEKLKHTLHLSKRENWILAGAQNTLKEFAQIAQIARIVLTTVGLELAVVYGLISPYDGRKLFASFERLRNDSYCIAKTFQPEDAACGVPSGNVVTRNRPWVVIALMQIPAFLAGIGLHEYGHFF